MPFLIVLVVLFLWMPEGAVAQTGYAQYFQHATSALEEGDTAAYRDYADSAVATIPEGHLNRPFVQYHLARADALLGDQEGAARALEMMWSERIEALMMTYAYYDAAFEGVLESRPIREVFDRIENMELDTRHVAGSVHALDGAGSWIAASIGSDGVLLVDAGYPTAAPAIRRTLESLGGTDPRYVVVTHAHFDHMGGLAAFGPEAVVAAHEGARQQMTEPLEFIEGVTVPTRTGSQLPDLIVYDSASIYFNGEEVKLLGFPAHSGGDMIAYFTESAVLHMGDNYFPSQYNFLNPGPDPLEFLTRFGNFLETLPGNVQVMGGHDAVTPVDRLREMFTLTDEAVRWVAGRMDEGATLEQIVAEGREREIPSGWTRYYYNNLAED